MRRVQTKCCSCRRQEAPFCEQKMADLPEDHLVPDKTPFTTVGSDCFSPFHVHRARSLVKRYGVIFTCMKVRTVHIEIAHCLDTDSFLPALRRFIARRDQVQGLRSDNGTNFTSGEREMRESVQAWNHDKIHEEMLQRNIKWSFNPPYGSSHGGFWERCLRSVRRILCALLLEQTTDDEGLTNLMCEAESILNSHITVITRMTQEIKALNAKSSSVTEARYFDATRCFPEGRTTFPAQRWSRKYIPLFQSRQKWLYPRRNLAVGDVVLVAAANTSRNSWSLGRIEQVFPDKTGFVRRVKVIVKSAILERPGDKLVLLVEEK